MRVFIRVRHAIAQCKFIVDIHVSMIIFHVINKYQYMHFFLQQWQWPNIMHSHSRIHSMQIAMHSMPYHSL